MHRSVHLLVFVFFLCCIVTFERVDALRRIKRGSLGTSSGPVTAKELAHDSHVDPSHKDESNNMAAAASLEGKSAAAFTSVVHTRSKKSAAPKTAIEKPISALLSSKANDDDKAKPADASPPTRSTHAQLQYTNTAEVKPSYISPLENRESAHKPRAPADSSVKELHKSPFTYWFDPHRSRWFDDAQLERTFNGDGPDVLIIDNGVQPVASERAAHNFRTPNLRSAARSLKSLADSGEQRGSGNVNDNSKQHNNHNDNNNARKDSSSSNASHNDNGNSDNNNKSIDTDTKINGSAQNNVALNANNNNNGNNNNNNSDNNKRERNNDSNAEKDNDSNGNNNARKIDNHAHQSAASDNAISANNNFNPNAINNDGAQQQQLQQQQEQQKMSVSPLLALAEGNKADNAAPTMQLHRLQPAGAAHQNKEQQQQQQLQSHFNGKMLPVDSMLKFANMLLYKLDGAPIHAQRAEVSINASPASVVSVGPNVESSDDVDTIDLFYNNLEPPLSPVIRFPQPLSIGGGTSPMLSGGPNALSPHPFVLPPFSFNEAPPPFNLLESALNLFLGDGDDDGEDQIELRCPIHHEPKKKAAEAAAGGAGNSSAEAGSSERKDDDGKGDVIQVCSCRFFKKKKSA